MSASRCKCHPLFNRIRNFTRRYIVLNAAKLDIVTMWQIGTWTFSPAAPAMPVTYPYLYVAGPKGSGKTVLTQDVFGALCRNQETIIGTTGATLFRIIGEWDQETGEITCHYPTLTLDEIDATYAGAKDESLRQVANAGYKRGATVPRSQGKMSVRFPVYCPKALAGIDNGHLPETITDRSIRIDMYKATREERQSIEPLYQWDIEEEAAELREASAQWAKDNAMVLRDYRPIEIPGMSPRQWEISRSLVQLARAMGNEDRIRKSLDEVMLQVPVKPNRKVMLYQAILDLFGMEGNEDRVTGRQILDALDDAGVAVPGGSGKGLRNVLNEDGIQPSYIRLRPGHPGILRDEDGNDKLIQRGYHLNQFDTAFAQYLADEDED